MDGLDECDGPYAQALIQDYCWVERVTETEGEASVRQLVQRVRDELDIMRDLLAEIDRSHVTYRKRAVQRAQLCCCPTARPRGGSASCCGITRRPFSARRNCLTQMTAR